MEDYLSSLQKKYGQTFMNSLQSKQKLTGSELIKCEKKSDVGPGSKVLLSIKHLKLKAKPEKLQT